MTGWLAEVLYPRHAEIFDLDIIVDAVAAALAAHAAFLDAAEGGDFGGNEAGVDADHARLHRLTHAPGAREIAGVEIAREADFGIVGHRERFFLGVEVEERGEGAEGFF